LEKSTVHDRELTRKFERFDIHEFDFLEVSRNDRRRKRTRSKVPDCTRSDTLHLSFGDENGRISRLPRDRMKRRNAPFHRHSCKSEAIVPSQASSPSQTLVSEGVVRGSSPHDPCTLAPMLSVDSRRCRFQSMSVFIVSDSSRHDHDRQLTELVWVAASGIPIP